MRIGVIPGATVISYVRSSLKVSITIKSSPLRVLSLTTLSSSKRGMRPLRIWMR